MSLFHKKRGRKKKKSFFKKILKWGISLLVFLVILPLSWGIYSFSSFFFLLPYQDKILGDASQKNDEKTYIITLHNESEIRPELGFLTSFIVLQTHGKSLEYTFYDSYSVSPPPQKIQAPKLLESRFGDAEKWQGWTFRDSNLALSHPENAQKIIEFLQYDTQFSDLKIDGVISLDLYSIGGIIDSLGGVPFKNTTITSENIFSILESDAKNFDHHDEEQWKNRKNSLAPLANTILKKILFSPLSWKNFSSALEKLLQQKHILIFFTDKKIQKIFSENGRNWTGETLLPNKSLLLGTNIANIGGRKGDRYIQKNFSSVFSVNENGKIFETVKIYLQHNGNYSLYSDKYFAEIQVLRNKNTLLKGAKINGENIEVTEDLIALYAPSLQEQKIQKFSFPISLNPGESKMIELKISHLEKFPNTTPLQIFSLHQPGVISQSKEIIFQGEGNTSFRIQNCQEFSQKENISSCQFSDTQDAILSIEKIPDTTPPVLERSKFLDSGKKAEIVFSEKIARLNPAQVLLREKISGKVVEIENIQEDGKKLILTFSQNIATNEKKFYSLQIDDLSDVFGNTIPLYKTTLASGNVQ